MTDTHRAHRKLAASLAADVVGYSGMMEADKVGTTVRLMALHNDVIDPRITSDGARIFKRRSNWRRRARRSS